MGRFLKGLFKFYLILWVIYVAGGILLFLVTAFLRMPVGTLLGWVLFLGGVLWLLGKAFPSRKRQATATVVEYLPPR